MAEVARRTYVRSSGPQPVHSRRTSDSARSPAKRQTTGRTKSNDAGTRRETATHHQPMLAPCQSQQPCYALSTPDPSEAVQNYTLQVMGPPPTYLQANTASEPSVMISRVRTTSTKSTRKSRTSSISSISNLVAVVTLLHETSSGSHTMPSGYLIGPRLFDNIHPLPESYLSQLPLETRESAIGYVSFPGLRIERAGVYRIRVNLMRLSGAREQRQDAGSVGSVDSGCFRVVAATVAHGVKGNARY